MLSYVNSTKLLLITSEFPPQPGGIGNHAVHLASSLQQEGYSVTVLTNTRSESGSEETQYDQGLTFAVKRIPRHKITLRTYVQRIRDARRQIRSNEVILASGKFSLWITGFWSLFYKRKYLAIIHGSELKLSQYLLQQFTQFCLKRFDQLIAVSNFTKNMLHESILTNTVVIPNGFEINASPKTSIDGTQPKLITVGNVTRRKGQRQVVNGLAIAMEKYPKLTYTMVGIPTEKQNIEDLAAVLGVNKAIHFTGKVSEEHKIKHLQEASIFVMLSENTKAGDVEGFGIAILEANALGVPAIGALHCGIEDAIDHGKSGLLIDGSDTNALLEAVEEITNDYQRFSSEAISWSTQFSWDLIVKRYSEVIEKV